MATRPVREDTIMPSKRIYCASCSVVRVQHLDEYCEKCIEDILAYLEEDEAEYLARLSIQQEKIDYSRQLGFDY